MEKITINGADKLYEIEEIKQYDLSVIRITFAQYVERLVVKEKVADEAVTGDTETGQGLPEESVPIEEPAEPETEPAAGEGMSVEVLPVDGEVPPTEEIPIEPVEPIEPAEPVLPEEPIVPEVPEIPEEPIISEEPDKPAEPEEPEEQIVKVEQELPTEYGDIAIYTDGGICAGILTGYNTVYRDEGLTVYLSNDGSVYTAPADALPREPYKPTLEELQTAKLATVNAICNATITAGCDVTLTDGSIEHFSLSETDQINLSAAVAAVQAGAAAYPYHADGELCRMYPEADIKLIGAAATSHKLFHTTYCNHLHSWIKRVEKVEELDTISYGVGLPDDLTENMAALLVAVQVENNE